MDEREGDRHRPDVAGADARRASSSAGDDGSRHGGHRRARVERGQGGRPHAAGRRRRDRRPSGHQGEHRLFRGAGRGLFQPAGRTGCFAGIARTNGRIAGISGAGRVRAVRPGRSRQAGLRGGLSGRRHRRSRVGVDRRHHCAAGNRRLPRPATARHRPSGRGDGPGGAGGNPAGVQRADRHQRRCPSGRHRARPVGRRSRIRRSGRRGGRADRRRSQRSQRRHATARPGKAGFLAADRRKRRSNRASASAGLGRSADRTERALVGNRADFPRRQSRHRRARPDDGRAQPSGDRSVRRLHCPTRRGQSWPATH